MATDDDDTNRVHDAQQQHVAAAVLLVASVDPLRQTRVERRRTNHRPSA